MPRTLRGVNSRTLAALRRREDGKARRATQGAQEDQEAQDSQAVKEAAVTDAQAASLAALTVPKLKERAASLGLKVGGTKVELIARISEVTS